MAELKYLTRENDTPQGKQRVYFCAHPEDRHYLKTFAKEIWEHVNAAIYYADSDYFSASDFDTDAHLELLAEMQLVIVPVTQKLMLTPNYAMDTELAFIASRQKRILPILKEPGLDDRLFSRKFGSIQYLDALQSDITALPYNTKFETYIKSALLGDELIEKVRAAFDAYVFLSYRKKDRKHAQELMRLIHENDFCRDIAIWYDEFLVPGEDFNSAIADAIRKSELFALAVTPNLINEDNYIKAHEYPMAYESKKKILPAEMEQTNKVVLSEQYSSIPAPVDAHNPEELSAALLDGLSHIAKGENANDPQHNYFVGLAYLNGIDVEENFKRGYLLILSAAEAGLIEAMEHLNSIHQENHNINRLYSERIWSDTDDLPTQRVLWPRRIAEYWETAYEKSGSFSDGRCYASKLIALAELHNPGTTTTNETQIMNFALSRSYYLKALEVCANLPQHHPEAGILWEPYICMFHLGKYAALQNKAAEAFRWYDQAAEGLKQLYQSTGDPTALRRYGAVQNQMGNIYLNQGKLKEAHDCYKILLNAGVTLHQIQNTFSSKEILSITYMVLARLANKEGNPSEEEDYYQKALQLRRELVQDTGSIKYKLKTIETCQKLAAFYERAEDSEQQLSCLKEAFLLSASLMEDYGSTSDIDLIIDILSQIHTCHKAYGEICESLGYTDDALQCYLAYREFELRISFPAETDISIRIGDIYYARGNYDLAEKYYDVDILSNIDIRMIEKAYTYGRKLSSSSLLTYAKNLTLQVLSEFDAGEETDFTMSGSRETYEKLLHQIGQALAELYQS